MTPHRRDMYQRINGIFTFSIAGLRQSVFIILRWKCPGWYQLILADLA